MRTKRRRRSMYSRIASSRFPFTLSIVICMSSFASVDHNRGINLDRHSQRPEKQSDAKQRPRRSHWLKNDGMLALDLHASQFLREVFSAKGVSRCSQGQSNPRCRRSCTSIPAYDVRRQLNALGAHRIAPATWRPGAFPSGSTTHHGADRQLSFFGHLGSPGSVIEKWGFVSVWNVLRATTSPQPLIRCTSPPTRGSGKPR